MRSLQNFSLNLGSAIWSNLRDARVCVCVKGKKKPWHQPQDFFAVRKILFPLNWVPQRVGKSDDSTGDRPSIHSYRA